MVDDSRFEPEWRPVRSVRWGLRMMDFQAEGRNLAGRLVALATLVLVVTSVAFVIFLLPEIYWSLPAPLRQRRVELVLACLAAVYAVVRAAGRKRLVEVTDAAADRAMAGGLAVLAGMAAVAMLACWVPHYLLWPWSRDADTFATLAQSWDRGIRPYRDIRGYNFPGALYLAWVLGKMFGWGRTWPLYAFDATALLLLGLILAAWSRRCLGGTLPGLAAYAVFLTYYLNRDFETVAQRDWYASLGMVAGLLILQAWPGRTSIAVAAVLGAAALSVRPHAVFFLPATACAVLEGAGMPSGGRAQRRRLVAWAFLLIAFTAMAFAPLVIAGIADDLIRGLRTAAIGDAYNRADGITMARAFVDQLAQPATPILIGLIAAIVARARGALRRRAATWLVAVAGALLYRVPHPVQHAYLAYPLALTGVVALAMPIGWIVTMARVPSPLRAIAVALLVVEASVGVPAFCNLDASISAIGAIARGETLTDWPPPGGDAWFDPRRGRWYSWQNYRDVVAYLRRTTAPDTTIANVLKEPPFPAINGPVGRISPFRAESGICWMWLVHIDLEPEFARALEHEPDCVVVWSPGEHALLSQLRLDRLAKVIRRDFRPAASFGRIEVWRRAVNREGKDPAAPVNAAARR
ncbi:MAG: hypothetical protein ACYC61_18585 [Isosphaeraceae bacterium]